MPGRCRCMSTELGRNNGMVSADCDGDWITRDFLDIVQLKRRGD